MLLVEVARKANETNELCLEGRLSHIISEVMISARKGNDNVRVESFASMDLPNSDIMVKGIAKRLTKMGFNVTIKTKDWRNFGNDVRAYYFEVDWKSEE